MLRLFLHSCFSAWVKEFVHMKHGFELHQREALLAKHKDGMSKSLEVWASKDAAAQQRLVLQSWFEAVQERTAQASAYSNRLLMHELLECEREVLWYVQPCLDLQNRCLLQGTLVESLEEEVAGLEVDINQNSQSLADLEDSFRVLMGSRSPMSRSAKMSQTG